MSSLSYVIQRIQDMPAGDVEIYRGDITDFRNQSPVYTQREGMNQAAIESWGKTYAGTFTALLRLTNKQDRRNGERLVFTIDNPGLSAHPQLQQQELNIDGIKQQLRNELLQEFEREQLRRELQELRTMLKQNSEHENRLGNIITTVATNLGWLKAMPGSTPDVALNGAQKEFLQQQKTDAIMHDINKLTEEQLDELDVIFARIFRHFGLVDIRRVADRLDSDPTLASTLTKML